MLPPTYDIGAMWTTPFMRDGARLYHSRPGGFLSADSYDGEGGQYPGVLLIHHRLVQHRAYVHAAWPFFSHAPGPPR